MRNPNFRRNRPSPFELGEMAARTHKALVGLPYGPGPRQDDYIRGYEEEALRLASAAARATSAHLQEAA